jgi:hypothetical protein
VRNPNEKQNEPKSLARYSIPSKIQEGQAKEAVKVDIWQ